MNCIVDYAVAKECCNEDNLYRFVCYKCGKCGRVFEDGFMVDNGGTHPERFDEE